MATRLTPEFEQFFESLVTTIHTSDKEVLASYVEQIGIIVPTLPNYFMTHSFVIQLLRIRDRCSDPIQKAHIVCAILRHPLGSKYVDSI